MLLQCIWLHSALTFFFPSTFFNPIHLFLLSFWCSGSPKSFLSLFFFFKLPVSPFTVQTIRWTQSGVSQPVRHQKHATCRAGGSPDTLYLWGKKQQQQQKRHSNHSPVQFYPNTPFREPNRPPDGPPDPGWEPPSSLGQWPHFLLLEINLLNVVVPVVFFSFAINILAAFTGLCTFNEPLKALELLNWTDLRRSCGVSYGVTVN